MKKISLFILILLTSCVSQPPTRPVDNAAATLLSNELQSESLASYRFHPLKESDYDHLYDVIIGNSEDSRFPEIYYPIEYELIFSREHMLLYPNSTDLENIKWRVVFASANNAIGKNQSDIGVMEAFITKMLKQGMAVEDIVAVLEQRKIYVNDFVSINNLFGVGRDGHVILLSIPAHYYPVAAFAVYSQDNDYIVKKIFGWELSSFPAMGRYFSVYNIADTNENGISEIVLQLEEGHSGIPGAESMEIYHIEWSNIGSDFEIANFPVFSQSCNDPCKGEWEFLEVNNEKVLRVLNYWYTRDECPNLVTEAFSYWDGEKYRYRTSEIVLPEIKLSDECQLAWAEAAISLYEEDQTNEFTEGWKDSFLISIFETSLKNWSTKADEIWGPASRDYARLKLGIWYDLRGENEKAKAVLQELANASHLPEYDLASRLALRYLEIRSSSGLIKACKEVNELFSEEIQTLAPEAYTIDIDSVMLEHFGTIDWKGSLCKTHEMFSAEFRSAKINSTEALEQWLLANEIVVIQQAIVDINDDGLEDHVLLMDVAGAGHYDFWVFFSAPGAFEIDYLTYLLAEEVESPFVVNEIQLERDRKAYLIKIQDEITVFSSSGYKTEVLMEEFGAESIYLYPSDTSTSVLVNINSKFQGQYAIVYDWSLEQKKFLSKPNDFELAQNEIENKLFVLGDYIGVIENVEKFIFNAPSEPKFVSQCGVEIPEGCKYFPEFYVPYFRYMTGLAYEKMEQYENARNVYFDLWQDFPDNVFGVVSSMKLERIAK